MNIRTILWTVASVILLFAWGYSWAKNAPDTFHARLEQLVPPPGDANIYGWQLMTGAERDFLHEKLNRVQSEEERQQIQADHHRQMQERAKQQGYTLPEGPRMHH
ncbi:MAG: hypothetical protein WCD07_02240 [Burkholderiales bacterium]